jgi:hypothetical protein
MYLPYAQNPSRIMHLLLRTRGAPLDWAAAMRRAILAIDRDEPLFDVKTLDEVTAETFSSQTAFAAMLSVASELVLLLAATGLYALLAWSVSQRTQEIGIRMAIGAAPADVVGMVLRQALQPVHGRCSGGRIRSAWTARDTPGADSRHGSVRPHRIRPACRYFGHGVDGSLRRACLSGGAGGPDCRAAGGVARCQQESPKNRGPP